MDPRLIVTCMPVSEAAQAIYSLAIKPLVAESTRLRVISFLDAAIPEDFARTVRTWIHLSNAVVAILVAHKSNNVLYEVGVAIGLGKPVILLADGLDSIPTMLRDANVVVFDPSRLDFEFLRFHAQEALQAALHGTFIEQRFSDHLDIFLSSAASIQETPDTNDSGELEAGLRLYRSKHYMEAAIHLRRALDSGSRDARTYFFLSDSYFFHAESLPPGERQRAAYQRMHHVAHDGCSAYPDHEDLLKNVALASLKLEDYVTAERGLKRLYRKNPQYVLAAYNLACLYARQRKTALCLSYLQKVFGKNPEMRFLARLDPDFDAVWKDELVQRVMYPCPINRAM